jgi:hypothetical protein
MYYDLPFILTIALLAFDCQPSRAVSNAPNALDQWSSWRRSLSSRVWRPSSLVPSEKRFNVLDTNPNGSTFLWLPQDEYSGKTFFE